MKNVAVRISIRHPEHEDYNCELKLDRDALQAIAEKAAGTPKAGWSYVRTELSYAIEQTVLNWAEIALKNRLDRIRGERELAEMQLDVARRLYKNGCL